MPPIIRTSGRSTRRRTGAAALCLTAGFTAFAIVTPPAYAAESTAAPAVVELTVADAFRQLESGGTTSVALVERYLARIAAYEDAYGDQPGLSAVITVSETALAEAEELDRERAAGTIRGPLHGVPIVVKDNYDTGDMPTSSGSASLAAFQPIDDATQVERLRAAGAIVIAKTNLHEFAAGITTISSLGGQTRNPYDQTRNPGGSSGGTGASVAASFATAGLGSDSCGSIRIPAAQNNLVGLRPTLGLSSRDGIAPMSNTQDVGGPISKTVEDAALILDATVGYDPKDPVTALSDGLIPDSYTSSLSDSALAGKTIGVLVNPEYLGTTPAEEPTTALIRGALDDMAAEGAQVVEITMPQEYVDALAESGVIGDEFKREINAYLAQEGATWPEGLAELAEPADALTLSDIIASGAVSPAVLPSLQNFDAAADLPNEEYEAKLVKQQLARDILTRTMADNGLDAVAYPTIRQVAQPVGETQPGTNCAASAQTGFPALSVPAGFTDAGLPVGIELMGLPFSEPTLLAMGYDYEQATQHRTAPASTPELEAVTPTPTDPAPTDPAPTDPAPTDPAPTDPAPTDPAPTDPAPTDPAPVDPPAPPADGEKDPAGKPGAAPAGDLAYTGADIAPVGLTAAALLLAGVVLRAVVLVRRRRAGVS